MKIFLKKHLCCAKFERNASQVLGKKQRDQNQLIWISRPICSWRLLWLQVLRDPAIQFSRGTPFKFCPIVQEVIPIAHVYIIWERTHSWRCWCKMCVCVVRNVGNKGSKTNLISVYSLKILISVNIGVSWADGWYSCHFEAHSTKHLMKKLCKESANLGVNKCW